MAVNSRESLWMLGHPFNRVCEIARESRGRGLAVSGVPRMCAEGIGLRRWPEDDWQHDLPEELPLNLTPGDRRPRVSRVRSQASVELGSELRVNRERLIALNVGQALPESNGQVGPLGLRQAEQLCEYGRRHWLMVAPSPPRRKLANTAILVMHLVLVQRANYLFSRPPVPPRSQPNATQVQRTPIRPTY